jgi:hypothetical protein
VVPLFVPTQSAINDLKCRLEEKEKENPKRKLEKTRKMEKKSVQNWVDETGLTSF